jgi:hypothetical protein
VTLTQRISRCESRMQSARCVKWRQLWCGVFLRAIKARNAMRSVEEVRELEKRMGLR